MVERELLQLLLAVVVAGQQAVAAAVAADDWHTAAVCLMECPVRGVMLVFRGIEVLLRL